MRNIRYGLIALFVLLCSATAAPAQVSIGIGIGLPHVNIGINLPLYPDLVRLPGYPVYYAPRLDTNYFFYDGMYWVYQDDDWYASSWYNGPWWLVEPYDVPVFILRIPVRYYRQPPVYFHGWRSNAPPRWGEHWGREWEQRRRGWDRWKRGSAPAPAPLPVYQRQYTGDRYPRAVEQQQSLRREHYRYQPRNPVVRQHFERQGEHRGPEAGPRERHEGPPPRVPRQQEMQRPLPSQQGAPAAPRQDQHYRGGEYAPRPAPAQPTPMQRGPAVEEQRQRPGAVQREMQVPRPQPPQQRSYERRESPESGQGREGHGEERDEGRGRGR